MKQAQELYIAKSPEYFGHIREDVIELIPSGVKKVLDVGCGSGATGSAIGTRTGAEVTGIELDKTAANEAEKRLHRVLTGSLEDMPDSTFPAGYFDCIVCADVLEHMVDPWQALNRLRGWLGKDGVLIASIPSIRHITVVLRILFDRWEYCEEGGILDKTHLRFFTLYTMRRMFADCGYEIQSVRTNASRTLKFKIANLLSFGLFRPFTVYQYRITARKITP